MTFLCCDVLFGHWRVGHCRVLRLVAVPLLGSVALPEVTSAVSSVDSGDFFMFVVSTCASVA